MRWRGQNTNTAPAISTPNRTTTTRAISAHDGPPERQQDAVTAISGSGPAYGDFPVGRPLTGSVTLRAQFPNADDVLLPGMYVRARLPQGTRSEAILVPHKALSRDPLGNALVMVVNAESKVEARPVKVAQSLGSDWVVTGGLAAGERVVVEGLQKVRPGAPVQAQEAGASTPAAGQAPAAQAS